MKLKSILVSASLVAVAGISHAANFVVDALANSSSGGSGAATVSLLIGQSFSVTVASTDLWSAGDLPRWSNADGLGVNLLATGSDDSAQSVGTPIGKDWGNYSQDGLSAKYGSLVGQIGSGNYFVVGTNFSGTAATAGTLKLFYWDSNASDNSQFITANVTAVPEPETYALMLAGLGAVGFVARRRRTI